MTPPNRAQTGPRGPIGPSRYNGTESLFRLPLPMTGRPEEGVGLFTGVVVGVEGTGREFVVQQRAAELAAMLGLRLRAVHVRPPGAPEARDVFRYIRGECRRRSVPFEGQTVEGSSPAEELAAEAGPRDLLVLGTRRLPGKEVVGSVARAVLAVAPCPVVLVRLPA